MADNTIPAWCADLIARWKAHADTQSADTQYRIYHMCGELRAAARESEDKRKLDEMACSNFDEACK